MRKLVWAPVALAALLLSGCGDHSLILNVDILSFLSPSETAGHYGPIPGGVTDSVTVVSRSLDLLPGVNDITNVSDVEVTAAAQFANATGSGAATAKIFVSAAGTDPFTADTTPIVLPVTLQPGVTDTVSVTVAGDAELAGLFLGDRAELGIRVGYTSGAGAALEGDFRLVTLRAVVTAKQDIVH
jgi:hypothetical protein